MISVGHARCGTFQYIPAKIVVVGKDYYCHTCVGSFPTSQFYYADEQAEWLKPRKVSRCAPVTHSLVMKLLRLMMGKITQRSRNCTP